MSNANSQPLLAPSAFVDIDTIAHLCTGGEAPWLKSHADVYREFAHRKGQSHHGRTQIYDRGERCRQRMDQLWHVSANRIAFMPTAAEGMSWLARGLDWQPGDNIVTTNLEFPSVAYARSHTVGPYSHLATKPRGPLGQYMLSL